MMLMDQAVIISIKGQQNFEQISEEVVELVTEGRLADLGDDGFTLSYQESELTGLNGTLTTFQIEKNRITLLRVGAVNSQMVFEEGRRHVSMYETPHGTIAVGVNTHMVRSQINARGGDIFIQYAIEIDHALAGENNFQISIRSSDGQALLS